MFAPSPFAGIQQTTSYKVVLPFYAYAAFSLVVGTLLLLLNTDIFHQHYFHPHTLAITHIMAMGWGTMIIFGASHQLLPVIIEGKLDSTFLAYLTFYFAASGIPFLIVGFYIFHTGWILQTGAILINLGIICYLINVISSIYESKKHTVQVAFMLAASLWIFSTTFFGLLLVFNFSKMLLPSNSVEYLTIHAHMGIIGWFLLMVIGVGSRLIPMFLISKYSNNKILWWIFTLINLALLSFILIKISGQDTVLYYFPIATILIAIFLFAAYCRKAYKVRIRRSIDEQMKVSLLSIALMLLPIIAILTVLTFLPTDNSLNIILLYGFCIFFGWITAIIFGMTFKTLPFIVWNKSYHKKAYAGKTPAPKELFSENIFYVMSVAYLLGFILFTIGIIILNNYLLKSGALILVLTAALYASNVTITLLHQPKKQ